MHRDEPAAVQPEAPRLTALTPAAVGAAAVVVLLCFAVSPPAGAREEGETPAAETDGIAAVADPWEPFRLLEGSWEAVIDGRLGRGVGTRRYEFILDGVYLLQRHASVRLPQEPSPEGDYHRELAVFSYDREREVIVLREFMIEGHVVRSTCEVEPKRFVCTAESVESGSGIRARLTIEIADRYRFDEIYELAFPGRELRVYFTNRWTRVPDLRD